MANYASLKSDIAGVIRTNHNEEITGDLLQEQLFNMVEELGAGYQYMGVAALTTNPGTLDCRCFYIASAAGTYTYFKNSSNVALEVADGEVAILKYDTSWSKDVTGAATSAKLTELGQEIIKLSGEITGWESGYRYGTGATPGQTLVKYAQSGWSCVKVLCNEGDVFLINSTGVSSYRSYAFANSSGVITRLGKSSSVNVIDIAQSGETQLIINTNTTVVPCYRGLMPQVKKNVADISSINSLISALTPQIEKVGGEITGWVDGIRYATGNGVGGTIQPASGTGWHSVSVPCYEGEIFIITGSGATSYRSYAFTDSNDIITRLGASVSNQVFVVAQSGEAKLYINFNTDVQPNYYSLMAINKLFPQIVSDTNSARNSNILYGKKWVAVGDSWTEPSYAYSYLIAGRNNMILTNDAVSGSGIAPVTGRTDNFSGQRLQTLITDHSDADYITICLGINDDAPIGDENDYLGESTEKDTFYGAWNYCLKTILTAMPSVKIGIIIPERGTTAKQNAIVNVAQRWGVPYFDGGASDQISLMGISSNLSTCMRDIDRRGMVIPEAIALRREVFEIKNPDNTWNGHPTESAHKYWSTGIEAFMRRL